MIDRRTLIGFAVAPLLPCLFASLFNGVRLGSAALVVSDTLRYAMVAYPAALLLGIPAYWLVARNRRAGGQTLAIRGAGRCRSRRNERRRAAVADWRRRDAPVCERPLSHR